MLAVPFLALCLLLVSPRRTEPTTTNTSPTHSQNLPTTLHPSPLQIIASPLYTNSMFKTALNISLCIPLRQCNTRKYKLFVYIPLYSIMVAVRRSYYKIFNVEQNSRIRLVVQIMVAVGCSHLKTSLMSCKILECISSVQHVLLYELGQPK